MTARKSLVKPVPDPSVRMHLVQPTQCIRNFAHPEMYRTGSVLPSYSKVRPARRITDSCMENVNG